MMSCYRALAFLALARAAPPTSGPYATTATEFAIAALDSSDARVWAWAPANATAGAKFPLVPYLHGVLGGDLDLLGYTGSVVHGGATAKVE